MKKRMQSFVAASRQSAADSTSVSLRLARKPLPSPKSFEISNLQFEILRLRPKVTRCLSTRFQPIPTGAGLGGILTPLPWMFGVQCLVAPKRREVGSMFPFPAPRSSRRGQSCRIVPNRTIFPCHTIQRHMKPSLDGTPVINLFSPARWTAESVAHFSDFNPINGKVCL